MTLTVSLRSIRYYVLYHRLTELQPYRLNFPLYFRCIKS